MELAALERDLHSLVDLVEEHAPAADLADARAHLQAARVLLRASG